ncbi:hypothetical protein ARAM_001992 [Aspergillus rambellii]|uniref:Transcription factor domain-containing protein n=1 Tax=Aspergillus rambellii TaxID=308745 RepID=A0A0F8W5Y8_9EURO|nr:hypothetical protein ARAM_001992 [Aspergillus rambellii]
MSLQGSSEYNGRPESFPNKGVDSFALEYGGQLQQKEVNTGLEAKNNRVRLSNTGSRDFNVHVNVPKYRLGLIDICQLKVYRQSSYCIETREYRRKILGMISDIKGHVSNPTDYDDTVADMNAQELSSSDPVLAASISNDANQPDVIPDSTPLSATCTPLNETDRDSDFAVKKQRRFTHILPFYALEEPMLYNALIACGARHMSVANPSYSEEKASYFYSIASRMLSDCLKDSDRDSALCATTAVALSVYEIMCFGPVHSRSHIIAATGLINECRWDSTTNGLGGACFWLNTAIELTGCLLFRRKLSSNPDLWGINMNMAPTMPSITGNEEIWTRRMIYICAKVSNFRLSISEPQEPDKPNHTSMVGQQLQEWETCKKLCDEWAALAPRSMMPLGHLQAWQTNSKSIFPEIWLLKRPSVIAHMFYHVTRLMLARTNPSQPRIAPEMQHAQQEHAYNVFGGVANVKDRGIAIMSIPLLLMAAECLIARDAQEEALGILSKVTHGTGWNLEQIKGQLQEIWAWRLTHEPRSIHSTADASMLYDDFDPFEIPHDVMNPGMDFGDFSVDNHGCHSFEDYYLGSFLEA